MPDPTPERIAAALALAEACDAWHGSHGVETSKRLESAVLAYRATAPKLHDPSRISDGTRRDAFQLILDGVKSDSAEWAMMRVRLLDESRVPASEPNRVTDHDADQRPPSYGPSSVDSSSPSEPAAGATLSEVEACSCEESEALKAEIAVLRAKISDCANHAQSGLGHGKYPSCSAETACRWIYQRLTNP